MDTTNATTAPAAALETLPDVMGYTVTRGTTGARAACHSSSQVAYFLTGKRGAVYALLRHRSRPELMFVVNERGNITALKGNGTWTDRDGNLRPWYGR